MHLFLDTTVFYDDPFLQKPHMKNLLNIFKQHDFKVYVSSVVLMETRHHYEEKVRENINSFNKSAKYLQDKHRGYFRDIYQDVEKEVEYCRDRFDRYYTNSEQIIVLEYDNNLLPELVNRSIYRIKPFTEKKQEFRDGIIWLTYARYTEENCLENCIFITNNSTDYLNKQELHKDLQKDTTRISIFQQPYGVLYSKLLEPYVETNEQFKEFVKKWNEMDSLVRHDILSKVLEKEEVQNEIRNYITEYIEKSTFRELYFFGKGEGKSKLLNIEQVTLEQGNFSIISGNLTFNGEIELKSSTEDVIFLQDNQTKTEINEVELEMYFTCDFNSDTYEMTNFIINSHYNLKNVQEEMAHAIASQHL
ncbi:PIN domain-containing protein [Lysinibacillus sp. 1 U-2021]|uniref:PIN domain-containing protein n=1 Tax=Lysinibacillus sp. 1 U-2021 TaxID=3039426 RepID=UPI002480D7D9|nr:PIN domain-containing protein [Lysinibacillus sp. 1 U-2021]WGT37671.1 PIN domain-containing protein [Lysinibacillus sp. 1 U-2021]